MILNVVAGGFEDSSTLLFFQKPFFFLDDLLNPFVSNFLEAMANNPWPWISNRWFYDFDDVWGMLKCHQFPSVLHSELSLHGVWMCDVVEWYGHVERETGASTSNGCWRLQNMNGWQRFHLFVNEPKLIYSSDKLLLRRRLLFLWIRFSKMVF